MTRLGNPLLSNISAVMYFCRVQSSLSLFPSSLGPDFPQITVQSSRVIAPPNEAVTVRCSVQQLAARQSNLYMIWRGDPQVGFGLGVLYYNKAYYSKVEHSVSSLL